MNRPEQHSSPENLARPHQGSRHRAWFLTGTDTEIGKTFTTSALLHTAAREGYSAAGLKPVAAGIDENGLNDDVEQILAASKVKLPREVVNPFCFSAAIAPHIAAEAEGRIIDFSVIAASVEQARRQAEVIIVEGVGGFCVPLGPQGDSADLAVALGLPVILVVGMRLGCINHAMLTAEAITRRGLSLAGWVANRIDPTMSRFSENLETLQKLVPAPLLGCIPWQPADGALGASKLLKLPT